MPTGPCLASYQDSLFYFSYLAVCYFGFCKQLESLMIPPEGSEPLKFKSVFAASMPLQAKACMERAITQVTDVRNVHINHIDTSPKTGYNRSTTT